MVAVSILTVHWAVSHFRLGERDKYLKPGKIHSSLFFCLSPPHLSQTESWDRLRTGRQSVIGLINLT